jgi:hypothetical protein
MAYGGLPDTGSGAFTGRGSGNRERVIERVKSLSYSATVNKLLLDVEVATDEDAVKTAKVGEIEIVNTGKHPAFAILAYGLWTAEGTMDSNVYYVNYLLKPNQGMILPDAPAIIQDEDNSQYDGTAITNAVPSVTANYAYSDSGTTIDDAGVEAADTTITVDDGDFFRVNDLIQFGINTTTATKIEICRVTAIATNVLTLERALYGTTANDKDTQTNATSGVVDDAKIYFPFFNTYHDHDKYTVVQTDSNGKFHAMNLFGAGRAATNLMGITAGSFSAKFYNAGYQNLGLSGITSSTETGLTAGGSYWFKIAIDGGTAEAINFTVDSSNTRWGGTNGAISLINTALEDKYNNSASNTFQQKSSVGIVNGDVRFTSGQRLSTSAIALTAGTDGASASYNIFAQQNGHIPALANVPDAVAAKLPDDVLYDRITYDTSPNEGAFIYDDGYGNLKGNMGGGNLNLETGEIHMTGCPPNAEFVYSCLHTSPFSGRQNATNAAKMNSLKAIYGNMPSQSGAGELTITRR